MGDSSSVGLRPRRRDVTRFWRSARSAADFEISAA